MSIEFAVPTCSFTLAEVAAGLHIAYRVTIDRDLPGVIPYPQDAGECGEPGSSGLIVFESLMGEAHRYCLCDVGLCPGPRGEVRTLHRGAYAAAFDWDGRSWGGPSDTEAPKGGPFPPGRYTLTVSAVGRWNGPDGRHDFRVERSLAIDLRE